MIRYTMLYRFGSDLCKKELGEHPTLQDAVTRSGGLVVNEAALAVCREADVRAVGEALTQIHKLEERFL